MKLGIADYIVIAALMGIAGVAMPGLKALRVSGQSARAPAAVGSAQPAVALPELPAGAVVFDLRYRGLSGGKDDLAYNSWWGFGGPQVKDTPFIAAVRRKAKQVQLVYNSYLKGSEWSALELKGGNATAFYFDLNADGKLTDNERVLPIHADNDPNNYDFVTPDFGIKSAAGAKRPFRLLMRARCYGDPRSPANCMWSPACVMEGTADFRGRSTKLILFVSDFSGDFAQFGRGAYALLSEAPAPASYVPREVLSRLINCEGQFYRLSLQGSCEKGKVLRVVLAKDTTPVGELAVKVNGAAALKAKVASLRLAGAEDNSIWFNVAQAQSRLPAGVYRIDGGYLSFGAQRDDEWSVDFQEGPGLIIDPAHPSQVELGRPVVSVKAIDEKDRYTNNPKESASYRRGATVYLSRVVRGEKGELFGRFSEVSAGQRSDKKPRIRILNADGKELLSKDMEYG